MDVSDISKVASRKRINADAEKLRDKVSRETAKIIKLKVAQDTAYWDVKEKLAQTERDHERLQQNMLDVQMQLEAASAQSQHELRLRPDTLDKARGTRAMCGVLEEYAARLRRGVARARHDQAALGAAYSGAARHVREAAARAARDRLRAKLHATTHEEAQRAAAARTAAAEARAAAAEREASAAREAAAGHAARHDAAATALQRREQEAAALQEDTRRLLRERDARVEQLCAARAHAEQQLKEAASANESLRAALERQEGAAQLLRGDAERLRAAAAQRDQHQLHQLQDAKVTIEHLNEQLKVFTENKKALEETISDKNQQAEQMTEELQAARQQLQRAQDDGRALAEQLRAARQHAADTAAELERAARAAAASEAATAAAEQAARDRQCGDERRIAELEHALDERARAAELLERDAERAAHALAAERDERARHEHAAAELRRHADRERDAAAARHAALEAAAAAREQELAKQMTMILELRAERERLQERIRGMRVTIDNIQKELTGRDAPPPPPRAAAERPHDAHHDASLFGFLSDGSVDGDAFDAAEVSRRFEALSRAPAAAPLAQKPISLSQLKTDMKVKNRAFFKNKRALGRLNKNK